MILLTGGAGYIGSHTLLEALEAGHEVLVLDNLCNSSAESIRRVEKLTGKGVPFIEGDIRDKALLSDVFKNHDITAVMHFAGLKAVGESVQKPLMYFDNNVTGSLTLLEAMAEAGVNQFIFSSSATVYGDPEQVPIKESCPTGTPTNPYGQSKLMIEQMLMSAQKANTELKVGILRYFNPTGAHTSGNIGEDPNDIPNNLVPYISQVAIGKLKQLSVFGGDYDTPDGTGVRDYIHVVDLAKGHLAALDYLQTHGGLHVWNLGTGKGMSVLDMVSAFEAASGKKVPYEIVERRAGDIATCYADPSKAQAELGWQAKLNLRQMMQDVWRWQSQNPTGYGA